MRRLPLAALLLLLGVAMPCFAGDSTAVEGIKSPDKLYSEAFTNIQNSYNTFLIIVGVFVAIVGVFVAIFVGFLAYYNRKAGKDLEKEFSEIKKRISDLEEKLKERAITQNNEFLSIKSGFEKLKNEYEDFNGYHEYYKKLFIERDSLTWSKLEDIEKEKKSVKYRKEFYKELSKKNFDEWLKLPEAERLSRLENLIKWIDLGDKGINAYKYYSPNENEGFLFLDIKIQEDIINNDIFKLALYKIERENIKKNPNQGGIK